MKQILVLGATGGIGHWVTKLLAGEQVQQTLYVRSPAKLDRAVIADAVVVQGDVLDTEKLKRAMRGQDIIVAALSGNLLAQARSIAAAVQNSSVFHIFWVTGLGIHHEVPGETGKMLDSLLEQFPDYAKAADAIAACGVASTLVRAANLENGNNMVYQVQQEGEPIQTESVDRCAVAKYIADRIETETDLNTNSSVGITNFRMCL